MISAAVDFKIMGINIVFEYQDDVWMVVMPNSSACKHGGKLNQHAVYDNRLLI